MGKKTQSLSGVWSVTSTDGVYKLKGTIPGTVFLLLEQSGYWGDHNVFYRENNLDCLSIADRDFIFEYKFNLDTGWFEHKGGPIFLEADGLDTLSEIYLNEQAVGKTENMHRSYRFDVSGILRDGMNHISIKFSNSLEYIRKEYERRPVWCAGSDGKWIVKGFNMIRKSHCSYGWDWGPKIPDIGIWRDIRLVKFEKARISQIHITQEHEKKMVNLLIDPETEIWEYGDYRWLVKLKDPEDNIQEFKFSGEGPYEIAIEDPKLWWPNGFGNQPLYELTIDLIDDHSILDRDVKKIGLRTLTIQREPDKHGESFQFVINDIPIFIRGANYIPEDVFLTRMNKSRTEQLIREAIKANFNSLRIWGGGIYPSNDFYDLCDQYGLIVWQDLMFACTLYDINNPAFLENIIEEVRNNLLRIRHHASLAMICGNNEMEWIIHDGIENIKIESSTKDEYIRQYETEFPSIVKEVCPEIFYWPASPSSGGNFDNPNSPERGNVHYWQVWHGRKDYNEYEDHTFRFLSEFGFESFPSLKTVESFTSEEDLNIFSPVMEEHQKCLSGNATILDYIARYYRYPNSLSSLIYVSQVSQAEAMRHGIEHLRRNRGISMGTLYWQLNDNWPVASWSSIDYYGRWKALHYVARRVYHNILLSSCIKGDKTQIHLSNESRNIIKGELNWQLIHLDGKLINTGEKRVETAALSSSVIEEISSGKFLEDQGKREILLYYEFHDESGYAYEGFHVYTYYKHLSLRRASIQNKVRTAEHGFEISIKTDYPVLFVELDLTDNDCIFSDNYFPLLPGVNRIIQLSSEDLTEEIIRKELTIRSLVDSY